MLIIINIYKLFNELFKKSILFIHAVIIQKEVVIFYLIIVVLVKNNNNIIY